MKKKTLLLMLFLMFFSTYALSQNWIQGKISDAVQAGISVELYKTSCGGDVLVDTFTTNAEGYYGFGCLSNGSYKVVPDNSSYLFTPEVINIEIPQSELQSYDFTAINPCATVRFLDNNDGTVTDCRTDYIWLKNANCDGLKGWYDAMTSATRLNSGECGLTDGSGEGDWHLATKEELQGLGTDPPAVWDLGGPSVEWGKPVEEFVNVQSYFYWTSTLDIYEYFLAVDITSGLSSVRYKGDSYYVWPVRNR
jgi:hypothetical protein